MSSTPIQADTLKVGLLTLDGRRTVRSKSNQTDLLKLGLVTDDGRRT